MEADANRPTGPDAEVGADGDPDADLAALSEVAGRLADEIETALPGWVVRCVERIVAAWPGDVPDDVTTRSAEEGRRAAVEVGAELRRLLAVDVDRQWTTPLTLVRAAARYPTRVLRDAGVPPVVRHDFDVRHFPDDDYGLTPMSFADLDPALQETGLLWGAAKARIHLARHGHKRSAGERR